MIQTELKGVVFCGSQESIQPADYLVSCCVSNLPEAEEARTLSPSGILWDSLQLDVWITFQRRAFSPSDLRTDVGQPDVTLVYLTLPVTPEQVVPW